MEQIVSTVIACIVFCVLAYTVGIKIAEVGEVYQDAWIAGARSKFAKECWQHPDSCESLDYRDEFTLDSLNYFR